MTGVERSEVIWRGTRVCIQVPGSQSSCGRSQVWWVGRFHPASRSSPRRGGAPEESLWFPESKPAWLPHPPKSEGWMNAAQTRKKQNKQKHCWDTLFTHKQKDSWAMTPNSKYVTPLLGCSNLHLLWVCVLLVVFFKQNQEILFSYSDTCWCTVQKRWGREHRQGGAGPSVEVTEEEQEWKGRFTRFGDGAADKTTRGFVFRVTRMDNIRNEYFGSTRSFWRQVWEARLGWLCTCAERVDLLDRRCWIWSWQAGGKEEEQTDRGLVYQWCDGGEC